MTQIPAVAQVLLKPEGMVTVKSAVGVLIRYQRREIDERLTVIAWRSRRAIRPGRPGDEWGTDEFIRPRVDLVAAKSVALLSFDTLERAMTYNRNIGISGTVTGDKVDVNREGCTSAEIQNIDAFELITAGSTLKKSLSFLY